MGPFYISLLETNKSVMFNLILNWSSWQCLNISSDVSPDPSLKRRSSNRAALIPFGWFIESSSTPPRRPLLIPLPNASTTPPSSSAKLHHRERRCRTRNKDISWPWKCLCSAIPRLLLENYAAGLISLWNISFPNWKLFGFTSLILQVYLWRGSNKYRNTNTKYENFD